MSPWDHYIVAICQLRDKVEGHMPSCISADSVSLFIRSHRILYCINKIVSLQTFTVTDQTIRTTKVFHMNKLHYIIARV